MLIPSNVQLFNLLKCEFSVVTDFTSIIKNKDNMTPDQKISGKRRESPRKILLKVKQNYVNKYL